jgi:hypothetical protein
MLVVTGRQRRNAMIILRRLACLSSLGHLAVVLSMPAVG